MLVHPTYFVAGCWVPSFLISLSCSAIAELSDLAAASADLSDASASTVDLLDMVGQSGVVLGRLLHVLVIVCSRRLRLLVSGRRVTALSVVLELLDVLTRKNICRLLLGDFRAYRAIVLLSVLDVSTVVIGVVAGMVQRAQDGLMHETVVTANLRGRVAELPLAVPATPTARTAATTDLLR